MSQPLGQRELIAWTLCGVLAWIRVGTRTPNATLRINDQLKGDVGLPGYVGVPAGDVRVWIGAPNCQPWDTTVRVQPGDSITLGMRMARCP